MDRKEFLNQVGVGAAALLLPMCLGTLAGCQPNDIAPTNVDFTVDISTGSLAITGGYQINNGVIVAHTTSGSFIAVSSSCTHQGSTVQYLKSNNSFRCPSHGATFSSTGSVTSGPASRSLRQYNTSLTGTSLRVFS